VQPAAVAVNVRDVQAVLARQPDCLVESLDIASVLGRPYMESYIAAFLVADIDDAGRGLGRRRLWPPTIFRPMAPSARADR
jgi:hypothetical protein